MTINKKLFFVSVLPVAFIVCGGISVIIHKQTLLDFIYVFIYYVSIEAIVFDIVFNKIEKSEKK